MVYLDNYFTKRYQNVHKVPNITQKIMIFIKYFFRPVFCRFCPKTVAVRPPIFPANHFLFSAGFELFCRIFGRLATVVSTAVIKVYNSHCKVVQ
jgi:hypothetical protein